MEYFSLEDRNYHSDYRVRAKGDIWWSDIVGSKAYLKERTEDRQLQYVNYKYTVCPLCEGKGSHVNPSIDACGLTAEDFHNDPQFFEDYRSGVYDILCNLCSGLRVIPEAIGEPIVVPKPDEDDDDYDDEPYCDADWN
jgi:hypothetical protein